MWLYEAIIRHLAFPITFLIMLSEYYLYIKKTAKERLLNGELCSSICTSRCRVAVVDQLTCYICIILSTFQTQWIVFYPNGATTTC